MTQRKPMQKFSLGFGILFYLGAVACLIAAGHHAYTEGTDNPIFASLAASVVFFIGSGIVWHVMGSVSLPDLKVDRQERD